MDHQAMIEANGAQVMPFDQNTTTHIFQKTGDGGVESVVVNDAQDQEQIGLIRAHLQEEATKFTQGNYEDPARIHGMDMPGLKELDAGTGCGPRMRSIADCRSSSTSSASRP
jgi:hypothetical protein